MQSDKIEKIVLRIILKKHFRASYELTFSSKDKVDVFLSELNDRVDYIQVGDEIIERKRIKKVVIKYVEE